MWAECAQNLPPQGKQYGGKGEDRIEPIRAAKEKTDGDTEGVGYGVVSPKGKIAVGRCRKNFLIEAAELVNARLAYRIEPPKQKHEKAKHEQRGDIGEHEGSVTAVGTVSVKRVKKIACEGEDTEEQVEHRVLVKITVAEHRKRLQKGKRGRGKAKRRQFAEHDAHEKREGKQTDQTEIGAVVAPRMLLEKDSPFFAQRGVILWQKREKFSQN